MKTIHFNVCTGIALALAGCEAEHSDPPKQAAKLAAPKIVAEAGPTKKVEVGKHVFLEVQGETRRVLVQAEVCLREGQLEQFLTRKRTKEHEAILAVDTDVRAIHTALTLARAEPGKPVQFIPKYVPASGTKIKITLEYTDPKTKKKIQVRAQDWIRNLKTGKTLDQDWVFAGSVLVDNPLDKTKPPFYAANDGDVICISNFDTAMLDLPISVSQANDELMFAAHTERIPPKETPVLVILEPILPKKR
jgi:hypothetical protein